MKESETIIENDIIVKSEEICENENDEKKLVNINNENNKIEEKENKEKQKIIKKQTNICQLCTKNYKNNSHIKCVLFNNCNHEICYICLYKLLIRSYIKSISQIHKINNNLNIKCICELGSAELSIQEINSILNSLNNSISNKKIDKPEAFSPEEKICENHNLPIIKFCLECFEPLCSKCEIEHNNNKNNFSKGEHKTTSYNEFFLKICKNLEDIPNLKIIFEDTKNFGESFYEKYCDLINIKFENLISEINYIKEKILDEIKKEYEKYKSSMEAIYLLYKYYNYELSSINNETDINQLLFLYNTNISIPELKYQFSKAEIILNDAIKKLNETKLQNMFEFKFKSINNQPYKCIQTIKNIHNTNIINISNLYNNKFITGDFEGNLKIWKYATNRYILCQELNNIYQGTINNICRIKLNKFAVCSQNSSIIKVFQEDIDTDKYILIQEIQYNNNMMNSENINDNKNLKFFNRINTLNDENSLIATTLDNYILIFQDKIGGIPKQNYLKTNYELVEFFEAYHNSTINLILHTKTENIITASEDATIKVWNKDRNYTTLIGHEDSVNTLIEIGKKYIASGSSDASIILWELTDNYNKYILKQKIMGHEFSVIGLAYLNNDRLISASIDDTIKIWQRNQSEIFINRITIKDEKIGIEGLVNINNETLLTYSGDKSIQVWSLTINGKINNKLDEIILDKEKNENEQIKKNKRTESIDYMVKNSIKEIEKENDQNKNEKLIQEDNKENKNEVFEINTSSNQNNI